jgi:hypothetical protein
MVFSGGCVVGKWIATTTKPWLFHALSAEFFAPFPSANSTHNRELQHACSVASVSRAVLSLAVETRSGEALEEEHAVATDPEDL